MVKTFSSGGAAVWGCLSGTYPSQDPVILCLFYSAMSTSIFSLHTPTAFFSSIHGDRRVLVTSHVRLLQTQILSFIHSWQASQLLLLMQLSMYVIFPVPENFASSLLDSLLDPVFFLQLFHGACWQTPKQLLTAVCEALRVKPLRPSGSVR